MTNQVAAPFYVKNMNNELVPAKFMVGTTGQFVVDMNNINNNPVNTRNGHYYDIGGNELQNFNPNNYIVVPINYDISKAIELGNSLTGLSFAERDYIMINSFRGEGEWNQGNRTRKS